MAGAPSILDVFKQDPFTTISLTAAVERNPYVPRGLGLLKLFEPQPIRDKALAVEMVNGRLSVIQTSDRGAPPEERVTEKRNAIYFNVPRIATADTVYARELMSVREIGTENVIQSVQKEVAKRLSGPTGLQKRVEFTWESHRLGAVQGILLDADKTPLFNFFTAFGIAQPAPVQFDLAAGTAGSLRTICNEIVRNMARASQGAFNGGTRVIGLCGDQFWDKLVNHPDVTSTYVNWAQAVTLREGTAFMGSPEGLQMAGRASVVTPFPFGDILWINYRGSDDLTSIAIPPDQARFFPHGADGVFTVAWAPHDSAQWLGKLGRPIYIIPIMDRDRQEWWRMECYSYPLHICLRPEVLMSGVG